MNNIVTAVDKFLGPRTVVWVGAGLSAEQDYPEWESLIKGLCERCGVPFSESAETSASDLMELADECKTSDLYAYEEYLVEKFGPSRLDHMSRDIHADLLRLRQPAYITTNFDHLLSRAAERIGSDHTIRVADYSSLITRHMYDRDSSVIYHLHGLAEKKGNQYNRLILSRSDFEEAYGPGGRAGHFARTVLHEWSVFFVGVGKGLTEDRYLRQLLEHTKETHDEDRQHGLSHIPSRAALVPMTVGLGPEEQADECKRFDGVAADLNELGVDCLQVPIPIREAEDGTRRANYGELDKVIEAVVRRRGGIRGAPRVSGYDLTSEPTDD